MATSTSIESPIFYVRPQPSLAWKIADGAYKVTSNAAAGALCGLMFSINPIGAAASAATSAAVRAVLFAIGDTFNPGTLRTIHYAVSFFAGIAAGFGVFVALGNPLTVWTAVTLLLGTGLSLYAIELFKNGAKCLGACAAGGALALRERFA